MQKPSPVYRLVITDPTTGKDTVLVINLTNLSGVTVKPHSSPLLRSHDAVLAVFYFGKDTISHVLSTEQGEELLTSIESAMEQWYVR